MCSSVFGSLHRFAAITVNFTFSREARAFQPLPPAPEDHSPEPCLWGRACSGHAPPAGLPRGPCVRRVFRPRPCGRRPSRPSDTAVCGRPTSCVSVCPSVDAWAVSAPGSCDGAANMGAQGGSSLPGRVPSARRHGCSVRPRVELAPRLPPPSSAWYPGHARLVGSGQRGTGKPGAPAAVGACRGVRTRPRARGSSPISFSGLWRRVTLDVELVSTVLLACEWPPVL